MLIAVHLLIAAHIAHWLVAGTTVTPVEPSEAMAFSKAGIVNAGLIFFAATILLTAIFGRWFCGWACHVVALQDGSLWLLKKLGIRPKPLRSRLLAWVPVFAFLYMFVWPAVWRLWHGDRLGVRGTELTTGHFWETFPGWVVGALTFVICGFVAVYFLGAKGFCTYACPYGAAFSWADRLSPMRIRVTDACEGCGHCTAVCTSNVRVHEEVRDYGMVVDPGCMKCRDCVSVCPNDALYYGFGRIPLFAGLRNPPGPEPETRRFPLRWSEEILVAAVFLVSFLVYRGLYGMVPFLLSLGLAGCLAFLALIAFRLVRRPSFAFRHRELKRDGRLLPAGKAWIVALAALLLLGTHSAVVHGMVKLGERDYSRLATLRRQALDPAAAAPAPSGEERAALERASRRYELAERWGLFPWLGLDGRLAWTRYLRGDGVAFERAARRAFEKGDSVRELSLLRALRAVDVGDAAAAAAALEKPITGGADAPSLARESDAIWVTLATRAANAGSAGSAAVAAELFERGLLHFPASSRLQYNAAVFAALQGQPEVAAEGFRRTLAIEPEHREARENLAGMLASLGSYEEAIALFRTAVARSPDDTALRVLLARALVESGETKQALEELETALRLAPGDPVASELRRRLTERR